MVCSPVSFNRLSKHTAFERCSERHGFKCLGCAARNSVPQTVSQVSENEVVQIRVLSKSISSKVELNQGSIPILQQLVAYLERYLGTFYCKHRQK